MSENKGQFYEVEFLVHVRRGEPEEAAAVALELGWLLTRGTPAGPPVLFQEFLRELTDVLLLCGRLDGAFAADPAHEGSW